MRFLLFVAALIFYVLLVPGYASDPLVAYWRFDDGTGTVAVDAGTYGNDGTLQDNASWGTGINGGALQCTGNDDHVDCSTDADFDNNGDGTFSDSTSAAGIDASASSGVLGDYDNDGDLDYFSSGSGYADKLYRNNGDGTFSDVTDTAGVGLTGYTLGCVAGDYDGDGYNDIYTVRAHDEGNVLYHNESI